MEDDLDLQDNDVSVALLEHRRGRGISLDIDPRIDLTKPIFEQAQHLWTSDRVDQFSGAMLEALKPHLTAEDDPGVWLETLRMVLTDIHSLEARTDLPAKQFVRVGCCSHWMRPHQTRWAAGGGFAWPSGWHGASGFSRLGLPELDWSALFEREWDGWKLVEKFSGKSRLEVRVSVPARTVRHAQAAIHTIWSPMNIRVFYGFRKRDGVWQLAARSDFYDVDDKE